MSLAPARSARSIRRLDEELHAFCSTALEEEFPYLILDARYEKVREDGVIRSRAVLVALGVDWQGRRQVLAVELANRESATSWKEFLLKLKPARAYVECLWSLPISMLGSNVAVGRSVARSLLATLLRAFFAQRARIIYPARTPTIACCNRTEVAAMARAPRLVRRSSCCRLSEAVGRLAT